LCPTANDISPFDVPIRPFGKTRVADQVAVLAKMLFTNSFQAACRKANMSGIRLGRASFQKIN